MRILARMSRKLSAWMIRGVKGLVASTHRAAIGPGYVITTVISLLLFAIIFPIAMTEVVGANTTLWEASVITIFGTLVPILAAVGIALRFIVGAIRGGG